MFKFQKGFTLIELLLTIAIVGIMAVLVVLAIDPLEKILRTRDTGRLSGVVQLGRYIESFYSNKANYPNNNSWDVDIVNSGELNNFLPGIQYTQSISPCSTNARPIDRPTFCYSFDELEQNGFIVFTTFESESYTSRCVLPDVPYFVFSSADGKSGLICSESDPTPWPAETVTYVE